MDHSKSSYRRSLGLVSAFLATIVAAVCWAPLSAQAAEGCVAGRSDFNGDGFSDAVIADTEAAVGGFVKAGRIFVSYGAGNPIGGAPASVLTQGTGSVGDSPEAGDQFGFSMAAADLNEDGCTDLVVGTPLEDVDGHAASGMAQVIWGDPAGLGHGEDSFDITQNSFGGTITTADNLGFSVDAVGPLGEDEAMIGLGVPGGDINGIIDAGWVGFFFSGDDFGDSWEANQDTPGVPGAAEERDRFGTSVSLGLLSGDGASVDAAVGAPGEDVGTVVDAGSVTIVDELYGGVSGGQAFSQESAGVPGDIETGDGFGAVLDTVRVGGKTQLAVGVPREDVGSAVDAGMVQLFSSSGTSVTPGAGISQDSPGVTGVAEKSDLFGSSVAFAPPGLGDTKTRLGVAVPSEDGPAVNNGLLQIFPLDDLDGETTLDQSSPGVGGAAEDNDRFGTSLTFVAGLHERSFLVGVPFDDEFRTGMVNVIPLTGGSMRVWRPGQLGIPIPLGTSRFGGAVAGEAR